MGQMDMDPAKWPDPVAMNRELHAMNFHTMISVWPRFVPEDRYYATLLKNGWFEHLADGTPTNGLPYDRAGSDIDTTNPDAAKWYWNVIKENYVSKGFDAFWADETEPDLPPNGSYFHIGPGTQFFNVYPLFHTAAFYNGIRQDMPDARPHPRPRRLSRRAAQRRHLLVLRHQRQLGHAQAPGPHRHQLRRLRHALLEHRHRRLAVSALRSTRPTAPPLLDPSDARENIGHYDDYPELYVRWFEYGAFQPNFRTHGTRDRRTRSGPTASRPSRSSKNISACATS